ncbi:unnamed protein product [Paramecium pentaurelia]|uniref:Uncharacterized protein n=1 Tax=Paramecium pentaurelia TaxID=43138 RepID=A0A8S1T6T4_9CILI|nr:unnamed protein product [Paramecium pentaurelia]
MSDDQLRALIQKNNLKIEQHQSRMMIKFPQTPQVRDSQQLSQMFTKSNNKSSSIDRSYFSCVPTRKSTKQSFFVPKSVATSQYLDSQAFQVYQPEDIQNTHIQDYVQQIQHSQMNISDNMDISPMNSSILNQLKREKEIIQQQNQLLISQMSREIENNKRQYQKSEQTLQQQIIQLQNELNAYKQYQTKSLDLEASLQQIIIENNELKSKLQEQNKWLFELQEQFDLVHTKMIEIKQKIQDTKHFSTQLSQIAQYLLNKQTPPLDFLVFMNNQSKQLQHEQQQEIEFRNRKQQIKQQHFQSNPFPIAKESFAQIYQFQIENSMILNQIVKDLRNNVDRYSQQYIAEVGFHLI